MIYVTGDVHGFEFERFKPFIEKNPSLTKNDYMIICGDVLGFGLDGKSLDEILDIFSSFPFTTLFIDGNHEKFDYLNSFPLIKWNGGKVHKIREDVIHLTRGQVFNIEGKTFFTFGGGTSIDKWRRTLGVSYFEEELPTFEEQDEAILNLYEYKNTIDYVITHSIDEKALYYKPLNDIAKAHYAYPDNRFLSVFEDIIKYMHWYFGHYHIDAQIKENKTCLYHEIIKL